MKPPLSVTSLALLLATWTALGLATIALLATDHRERDVTDRRDELWDPERLESKTATTVLPHAEAVESMSRPQPAPVELAGPAAEVMNARPPKWASQRPPDALLPDAASYDGLIDTASGRPREVALLIASDPDPRTDQAVLARYDGATWQASKAFALREPVDTAGYPTFGGVEWPDGTMLVMHRGFPETAWLVPAGSRTVREVPRPPQASTFIAALPLAHERVFLVTKAAVVLWTPGAATWRSAARPWGELDNSTVTRLEDGRVLLTSLDGYRTERVDVGRHLPAAGLTALLLAASVVLVMRRFRWPDRARPDRNDGASPAEPALDFLRGAGLALLGLLSVAFLVGLANDRAAPDLLVLGGVSLTGLVVLVVTVLYRRTETRAAPLAVGAVVGLTLGLMLGLVFLAGLGFLSFGSGRPIRAAGRVALPRLRRGARRAERVVGGPGWLVRRACRRYWTRAAQLEAASVPTFERLAGELAQVGAPQALAVRARAAARDEVEHASACVRMSVRFGARELALDAMPPELARPRALPDGELLRALAVESLLEGCLEEGFAAAAARAASEDARDPEASRTLARIAQDEARHAELAWDIVASCLAQGGPPVRDALSRTLGRLGRHPGVRGLARSRLTRGLQELGVLVEARPGSLFATTRRAVHDRARALLA